MRLNPKAAPPRLERAGWTVSDWCRAVGFGRSTFYALDPAMRPASVQVGARRIVAEPPKEWLARVAQLQARADAS
jgi:hypothetical protein